MVSNPQECRTASPACSSWASAGPAGITMEIVSPATTCKGGYESRLSMNGVGLPFGAGEVGTYGRWEARGEPRCGVACGVYWPIPCIHGSCSLQAHPRLLPSPSAVRRSTVCEVLLRGERAGGVANSGAGSHGAVVA